MTDFEAIKKKRIVLASGNAGKIREIQEILATSSFQVIPQSYFGITDVDEPASTFVENALIKARNACTITNLSAIADDSGICIKALNDAPGIYSARYAGPAATSADRIAKVLHEMKGVPTDHRQAAFHCVIVYLEHAMDPNPLIAHGSWDGVILEAPQGSHGFGYDPIFFDPKQGCTAAALDASVKNRISHRAKALQLLSGFLSKNNP